MKYYIDTTVETSFNKAIELVKNTLPEFGFGIVTEFSVDKKFKEKLGIDYRQYTVLGACNPKYAYDALQAESMIGTMLPCNIVVQEINENEILIAAIDPVASMQAVENSKLINAAHSIKEMLEKFINQL